MKDVSLKLKNYLRNYDWKIITKIITFILLLFLISFDQLMKWLARKHLDLNTEYHFLPGFINFQYVINYGSAFGLNQKKTTLLVSFAFVIAFILLIWWIFNKSTTLSVGITFILSGTIGNLIDRFLHNGGVIDFLKWDMFYPKTVLNIADILVTFGIIIIIINFVVDGIKGIINDNKANKVEKKNNEKKRKSI